MSQVVINLTQNENIVLDAIIKGMYAELGFSDYGFPELVNDTKYDIKSIRGIVGSLVKKGVVDVDERESEGYKNKTNYHIIYINYEELVPNWLSEMKDDGRTIRNIIINVS